MSIQTPFFIWPRIDNSTKTNWKFIGIVVVLAVLIGGGILWYGIFTMPQGGMIEAEMCGSYLSYHDSKVQMEVLEKDCSERGGRFVACGPACSDGQTLPIAACTPACYLEF